MAWLRGQATQSTLVDKLTKLIAGEVADDAAVTVAVGDRWIRSVAGQDHLVSPASKKIALGNMSMRCGYFQPGGYDGAAWSLMAGNWFRVTNIFTSAPGGAARWRVGIWVIAANTVANNYSNATIGWYIWNSDTGASINNSGSAVPNAAGDLTIANGLTVRVGNSEDGILKGPDSFNFGGVQRRVHIRDFTSTYVGGIDFWPLEYRRYPGESSTFSVAPPGVAGTDYDKDVRIINPITSTTGIHATFPMRVAGGCGQGLGIKTNTGLGGGALYTVTWNVFAASIRLAYQSTSVIRADLNGGWAARASDSVYQRIHGFGCSSWLRMFTGSPLSSSVVQYWMCVKADRIMIILNGDPGVGGILSINGIWSVEPFEATYDKFTCLYGGNQQQYQSDHNSNANALQPIRPWSYYTQRAVATNYGMPASRDWATGWMRTDSAMPTYMKNPSGSADTAGGLVDDIIGTGQVGPFSTSDNNGQGQANDYWDGYGTDSFGFGPYVGFPGGQGFDSNNNNSLHRELNRIWPVNEPKPSPGDTRWWLYGPVYTDTTTYNNPGTKPTNHVRGKVTQPFLLCPSTGWSSGDELTDTVSGKVWFLVAADYAGQGLGRIRTGANTWATGIAVLEEA